MALTRREARARQKALPEFSRDHREILVGRPYGQMLLDFLNSRGISGATRDESYCDIITLPPDCDLNVVENVVREWVDGWNVRP